ncbi:MAG TPA: hypothetical protein P5543_11720, partial [Planctomycetota bacterium]|nr:hypothetical protein [Planctomycetota bacterium]
NAKVTVSLLNSIAFANYLATNASDVVLAGTENQDFNVVYSIFGQSTINPTASLEEVRLIANETSIKRVFSNANRDTEQRWIPVVDQDGFATIRHTGEAAIEGTLTAKVGNAFYYYDMSSTKWRSFDSGTVYNFVDDADNNYGLPVNDGTVVYTIAANADVNKNFVSRTPTLYYFNVGAYALHGGTYQDATLIVTTNQDGINIFDNYTTLREALVFAANRVGAVFENGKESYTITFADTPDVWSGGTSCTITLTRNYEELRITNGLSGKSLTIDPGMSPQNPDIPRYVTINVENPGLIMINNLWQENENADKFRVFQVGTSYDVTSDWNINFLRTTLISGKILPTDSAGSVLIKDQIGNGGVVYIHGKNIQLTLDTVTLQGGHVAASGAGLYAYATENSHIISKISTVRGVKATTGSGGGIYNYAKIATITMNNSTIDNAQAGFHGGGIYNYSTDGDATITIWDDGNHEATRFYNNSAEQHGGGIYNESVQANALVSVVNAEFHTNKATLGFGGGIYNFSTQNSEVALDRVSMTCNRTMDIKAFGASVYNVTRNLAQDIPQDVVAKITAVHSTISKGYTQGHGSAFYNYAESYGNVQSSVTLENSTITENEASEVTIYVGAKSLSNNVTKRADTVVTIVNSTVAGNQDNWETGGIYVLSHAAKFHSSKLYLLNSIVYANYKGSDASDIIFASTENNEFVQNEFHVAYSIYGQSNINPGEKSIEPTQFKTTTDNVKRIFADTMESVSGVILPVLSNVDKRTIRILPTGEAAIKGTLIGKIGNDYFYYNMANTFGNGIGKWMSFTNDAIFNFNKTATNYGLTGGNVTVVGQNFGANQQLASRVQAPNLLYFNVGAYVLIGPYQEASITVNDNIDGINIFDDKITFREALAFAANSVGEVIDGGKHTITILYDKNIFTGASSTITLSETYGELVVTNGLSGKKLIIDPGKTSHNVQRNLIFQVNKPGRTRNVSTETWHDNEDASNYRVFRVGSFFDQYSNWDIEFYYSTIKGGKVEQTPSLQDTDLDDHGGAFSVRGKNARLELNYSAVLGSIATGRGGGIYMDLRNSANLFIQNSSIIEGNKGYQGGGIYIYGEDNSNIHISSSSLMKQEAIEGGAIYSISDNKAVVNIQDNSLLYQNTAVDGGVIYSTSPISSDIFIQDAVLFKNVANRYGGAIYGLGAINTITLNNAIFTGNTAQYGGAIATRNLDTANLLVQNSTISGNIVTGEGGGIYYNNTNSIVTLLNSIVFANYKNTVSNDVFI